MSTFEELQDYENELKKYIYDPNYTQSVVLDRLSRNDYNIPDPTNPFMWLLENSVTNTSVAMQEMQSTMRRLYSDLANSKDDLYHHINMDEINDVFATPSKAMFNLYINKNDIKKFGNVVDGSYSEIIIPKYSTVTIDGYIFTILNDILIRIYDNNKLFVKYNYSDLDIAYMSDTLIESSLVTDNNGMDWVMLNIELKQIIRYSITESLFKTQPFLSRVKLNDNEFYNYIRVYSYNNTGPIELSVTHSNFVYDPNVSTAIVKPSDNEVLIEIPSIYLLNNMVKTSVIIEMFTTNGELSLELTKYKTTDFTFTIGNTNTDDPRIIGINSINFMVNASTYTYGGMDDISFTDLKSKVVNYSTGDNNIPMTIYEIEDTVGNYGFEYINNSNSIMDREFYISKDIGTLNYQVPTTMDVFYDNVRLNMMEINSDKIIQGENFIILEPFQIFKQTNNTTKPLTNVEAENLKLLVRDDLVSYNNLDKHFFTLYKYILDYETFVTSRVYDVNAPTIYDVRSLFNNNTLKTPITISSRQTEYLTGDYKLTFGILPDSELFELDITKLFAQFTITFSNSTKVNFRGTIENNNDELSIVLNLNMDNYIDIDDKIRVYTDVGSIPSALIDIITEFNMVFYTTDTSLDKRSSVEMLNKVTIDEATVILYEEEFKLEFAKKLDFLFTNYYIDYTERKFLTYTEDVYKTYETDIYELDENGLVKTIPVDSDGDGVIDDVDIPVLYNKGDLILDADDNPIILHKKGDIILDEDNKPMIDQVYGIIHNITFLLIEDIFLRITDPTLFNYRIDYFINLTKTITDEITAVNVKLLDNTVIKFMPKNNLDPVILTNNFKNLTFNNFISPIVYIYVSEESEYYINDVINNTIYTFLQQKLQLKTNIQTIENELAVLLGNDILSVKITDITDNETITTLNYFNNSSRFIIKKNLIKKDNTITIQPDVKVVVNKI